MSEAAKKKAPGRRSKKATKKRSYVKSGKYAKQPSASVACDDATEANVPDWLDIGAQDDDEMSFMVSVELDKVGATINAPSGEYEVVYTCKQCGAASRTVGVDMVEKTCCCCFLPMRRAVHRLLDEDGE